MWNCLESREIPLTFCPQFVSQLADFERQIFSPWWWTDLRPHVINQKLSSTSAWHTGYWRPLAATVDARMDVDQFTSPTFNAVTYLNQHLPPGNPDTYHTSATTLLPTLELLARNVHSELTTALNTLLRTSTRLGIDIDTLTHDTRVLSTQIPRIETDVSSLQLEGGVLSELAMLEVVQERMQQTLEMFQKAQKWDVQVDEGIRFLIESAGLEVASLRIGELQEMLPVWMGTVEYTERVQRIQGLEKMLSSAQAPPQQVASTSTSQRTHTRTTSRSQSRLRMDSSDSYVRESGGGGIFGQFRQNIGR